MYDGMAVSVRGLVKAYRGVLAVNGISFDIAPGETFALLGPNGAGKTSTLEILEGYRERTDGDVSVLGFDPGRNSRAFRERIGLVLQTTALEPELTTLETLTAFSHFYPRSLDARRLLDVVNLESSSHKRVKALSGGQQRRLEIAIGLIGDPQIIFLDEPTTGLDPEARAGVWRLVRRLGNSGKTVVLTSHYMEEVEALAQRVAIMVAGELKVIGELGELLRHYGTYSRFRFHWTADHKMPAMPASWSGATMTHDGVVEFLSGEPGRALGDLVSWGQSHAVALDSLTVEKVSLEEIYLDLTGAKPDQRELV